MCLKLSIAITGRSSGFLPKWCSGWVNLSPSAVRKLIEPVAITKHINYSERSLKLT